jgi:[ribosomal protein S5]-alanine N-acetyltransferase
VTVETIRTERLELVSLSPEAIDALLDGSSELGAPEGWPDEHDAGFLRLRRDQMLRDPDVQQWGVRAVLLDGEMIGHAGFHGPPGVNGPSAADAVEIGYSIFEPWRGQGYATEVARALIEWARRKHGIPRFIASVSPGNAPSLAVVRKLGFVQTGEQWDDEDGLELVFELADDHDARGGPAAVPRSV